MGFKQKILIVEDENVILNFLSTILTMNEYSVIKSSNGNEGLSLAASHNPDLILLDLGLPDFDGFEVLKRIREWSDVPIIVVSARHYEKEKVKALDLGADDYITKPFGNNELLARIRTVIRRTLMVKNSSEQGHIFSVDDLTIDYLKRTISLSGEPIHLTPIEYKIIVLLSKNAGKVLTHDYIMREIWGQHNGDNQILRVNMANIRRIIEKNPADPKYILTEIGVGYRMVDVE